MPFDQTVVTRLYPPKQDHAGLRLSWDATSPPGTYFQVYVARRLVWFGLARTAIVPTPAGKSRIDVGEVGPDERDVDFSATLPAAPKDRVELAWTGSRALGLDIAGFRVYQGVEPGGMVDYAKPVGEIPLSVGAVFDGFGFGSFGAGGFGFADSNFAWTSAPLKGGVWSFAIVSFDGAGNEGAAATTSALIVAPPAPPARSSDQQRLHYEYNPATHEVTLAWLASPG